MVKKTKTGKYDILLQNLSSDLEKTYINLLVIRRFEENLLRLFSENKLFGTTHTCIGQEAVAVTSMECIKEEDIIFSNHRCHGHFIAYSHHPEYLLKEIMGKKGGVCEGRGGSQHIRYHNFYSNGIQGGIVPNAVGAAWAEKLKGTDNIAVVFLGDGTLGQGIVYESLNIASLKDVPVLFIVEENGYAMSTKTAEAVSGEITARAQAFNIAFDSVDGNDVDALRNSMGTAYRYVREKRRPFMLAAHTYRLAAHSKGDDPRDTDEISEHWLRDPVENYGKKLTEEKREMISQKVDQFISDITEEAESEETAASCPVKSDKTEPARLNASVPDFRRCIEYINYALLETVKNNKNVIVMGEDICDPYGGAFKATKGLSTEYPDQIINMPISEAAMCGISVGMALNGIYPIMEVMFGDFITLAMDQLVNHASKYQWVYGDEAAVPFMVRTPMGGRRGYGPTHSQSLEKLLIGIPNVMVMALSPLHNPVELYRMALQQKKPVIMVENKVLYTKRLMTVDQNGMLGDFHTKVICNHIVPTYLLSLNKDYHGEATLITYGGMTQECMDAAMELMVEDEISVNVIVLGQLSEMPWEDMERVRETIHLAISVEEGTVSGGIGAEIIAGLCERGIGKRYARIAAPDQPIPNSLFLEKEVLPDAENIADKVRTMINEQ